MENFNRRWPGLVPGIIAVGGGIFAIEKHDNEGLQMACIVLFLSCILFFRPQKRDEE
jgi:hypothetical protein